jgi:hypothetical protein
LRWHRDQRPVEPRHRPGALHRVGGCAQGSAQSSAFWRPSPGRCGQGEGLRHQERSRQALQSISHPTASLHPVRGCGHALAATITPCLDAAGMRSLPAQPHPSGGGRPSSDGRRPSLVSLFPIPGVDPSLPLTAVSFRSQASPTSGSGGCLQLIGPCRGPLRSIGRRCPRAPSTAAVRGRSRGRHPSPQPQRHQHESADTTVRRLLVPLHRGLRTRRQRLDYERRSARAAPAAGHTGIRNGVGSPSTMERLRQQPARGLTSVRNPEDGTARCVRWPR